jgi:hypothetical protein
MMSADRHLLLRIQRTQVATVEVTFCDRTEQVPITMTWEDYLDKRGLYHSRRLCFYDLATGKDLTWGSTLEEMGYRGGKLVVQLRYVTRE